MLLETDYKSTERKAMSSVCLFGLSGDPPTGDQGHVGIVRALCERGEWDEIWVLPVFRHTYSEKRDRLASFDDRLRMCQLAVEHLVKADGGRVPTTSRIVVSSAERASWEHAVRDLDDEEKSTTSVGTAALLEYLELCHPDKTFSFCLGADAYYDLINGKWKESDRVLRLLGGRLVVFHRNTTLTRDVTGDTKARWINVDHLGNVSSSKVRECDDPDLLRSLVVPSVLQYMKDHRLYRFSEDLANL